MPPASENVQQGTSNREVGRSSFPVPCWIFTFLVMTALPVRAQETVTIRYQPPVGRVLETRTEMHTTSTLTGFPLIPDGSRLEEELLIGATQRVTGTAPGGMVVEVAVDSVRGRMRPTGGAWHDLAHPLLEAGVARAVVSDQFKVVGIQSQGTTDGDLLQALGGFVIGLGFAFPSDPIAVGTTVATDGRVRTRVQTDSSTGLVLDQTMIGDLEITLDSVVHNPGDELSYFEFRGEFAPRGESESSGSGDPAASYTGAFAGRFIWSAGWNAITAAAVRLRVEGRVHGQQNAQVTWDRTITHRLRP
jgi:hypothetical protein